MLKRLVDIAVSLVALTLSAPLIGCAMVLVWVQDGHTPLYRASRVGRHDRDFRMLKLRSMRIDADGQGGTSTAVSDARITPIGRVLRRTKLDEFPQFWNVITGEMSVVGPRPNTRRGGVDNYTPEEMDLLAVRPGITDLASIVFSDEGAILEGAADPDAAYDRLIRPWKSRLGLLYTARRTVRADLMIMILTLLAVFAKRMALCGVGWLLRRWRANEELREVCKRVAPLVPTQPPGATTC